MAPKSAGILVYRRLHDSVEFLLAHPGGPFWMRKDEGAWSIPKGLIDEGEESQAAALREFREEIGQTVDGEFFALSPLKQKSGKVVYCWMVESNLDLSGFASNHFEMEWPKGSGSVSSFPEIDKVDYFKPPEALRKILPGQAAFITEALEQLGIACDEEEQVVGAQGSLF